MYVAPISCKDGERERKKEKNYQKHEMDARIPARGFSPAVNYNRRGKIRAVLQSCKGT